MCPFSYESYDSCVHYFQYFDFARWRANFCYIFLTERWSNTWNPCLTNTLILALETSFFLFTTDTRRKIVQFLAQDLERIDNLIKWRVHHYSECCRSRNTSGICVLTSDFAPCSTPSVLIFISPWYKAGAWGKGS